MRRAWAGVLAAAMLSVLAGCAVPTPATRAVNLGFETVTDPAAVAALAPRLDAAHANAVAISAGRPEWTAAPWAGNRDEQSSAVTETGRDYIAEAVSAVGQQRDVTLVVDLLAPRHVSQQESFQARNAEGAAGDGLVSPEALTGGYGDLAVAWVEELAQRYRPDAIALTELFVEDPSVPEEQRVEAVTALVRRAAEATHRHGVRLTVDVRANAAHPSAARRDSGQDYAQLLSACDGLTVWAYAGLSGSDGARLDPGRTARELRATYGERVEYSVGLWADGDATLAPAELRRQLTGLARGGATHVSVTPASRMGAEHWKVLDALWG